MLMKTCWLLWSEAWRHILTMLWMHGLAITLAVSRTSLTPWYNSTTFHFLTSILTLLIVQNNMANSSTSLGIGASMLLVKSRLKFCGLFCRTHRLLISGMKLQKCHPSLFNACNVIIQADQILTGSENFCTLWTLEGVCRHRFRTWCRCPGFFCAPFFIGPVAGCWSPLGCWCSVSDML